MLPDQVSNPGPLTYKSGALPIALCGLAYVFVGGGGGGGGVVGKWVSKLNRGTGFYSYSFFSHFS